jgi:hypothetical protein
MRIKHWITGTPGTITGKLEYFGTNGYWCMVRWDNGREAHLPIVCIRTEAGEKVRRERLNTFTILTIS